MHRPNKFSWKKYICFIADSHKVLITFSRIQDLKTGSRFIKNVYDKSRTVRFGSPFKEDRPSEPIEGHDISTSDSISGQEAGVADRQSSLSWLQMNREIV